jgi:hypothetical protein
MAQTVTCDRCGEQAATWADGTVREPLQHAYGPTLHTFTAADSGHETVPQWVKRARASALVVKEYTR